MAAQGLSDEPDQRWTFPAFADRHMAMSSPPLAHVYEDLASWADLENVLKMSEALSDFGIPDEFNVSVSVGFQAHEELLHSETGRLAPTEPGDPYRGRHNVAVVGWDHRSDSAVFRNSWGGAWGDQGIGYISEAFFGAHVDRVVVRRDAHVGPSRAMNERMRADAWRLGEGGRSTGVHFLQAWETTNVIRAKSVSLDGRSLDLLMRELLDLSECRAFRILELREGDRP